jgi:hypothetical protein
VGKKRSLKIINKVPESCISPNSKRFYTFCCDQNTPKTKGCLNFLSIQKLELLSSEEISSNYSKHLGCELLSSEEISFNYLKYFGCELLSSEEISSNYLNYLRCELLSSEEISSNYLKYLECELLSSQQISSTYLKIVRQSHK